MAERVAEHAAADAGLTGVTFTSAGTSAEEWDEPIDSRAAAVLTEHGYRADGHRAHRVTKAEIEGADLVIAMEDLHLRQMTVLSPGALNISLLTDFDPAAAPGSGVPDPWYGTAAGFENTLEIIKSAMPGVLDRVRELQADRAGHRR
jgi:protein-tyrosine phosphatase